MFTDLSLRLRIFLFFCLLAAGGVALAAGAMALGWSRAGEGAAGEPFLIAFLLFLFLNTGLVLGVWLLFDEHVAKPIKRLSADLRLRAHSGVGGEVDPDAARYLGDLAPAANALTRIVSSADTESDAKAARQTERLKSDSEKLMALLSEIPIATILLNPADQIVLYDSQAAGILTEIAPPRLKAPLSAYFDISDVDAARERLSAGTIEVALELCALTGRQTYKARLKALGNDCHMVFITYEPDAPNAVEPRPVVFDFDLMATAETKDVADTPLSELCFVAFDTETTGLDVETDAIVQLAAVRILNGRIIDGEVLNSYVHPGRAIPASSTRIHRVTDADVAEAPGIGKVGRDFHHFAEGAVLVAHNAPFDIGLLRRFQREMGVEWAHPVLDTVLLSAVVFGTGEDHSLDALCARLAVILPAHLRHTAHGDAQATGEALVKLLPLLEAKGIRTFADLIQRTRKHRRLLQDMND